jgi:hypothetical protein
LVFLTCHDDKAGLAMLSIGGVLWAELFNGGSGLPYWLRHQPEAVMHKAKRPNRPAREAQNRRRLIALE